MLNYDYIYVNGEKTKYVITTDGSVYNTESEKQLAKSLDKNGYVVISIHHNNKHYMKKLHRLVAEAFIPNPENKPQVNHIDGVKTNNTINNLEWCTCSENIKHAFKIGLKHPLHGNDHPETVYSDELIIEACKYLNKGKSLKKTSKKTGIPLSFLYRFARGECRTELVNKYLDRDKIKYDINSKIRYDDEYKNRIIDLYKSGLPPKKIKEKLNIESIYTINNIIYNTNIRNKGSTTIENTDDDYYRIIINV